MGTSTAAEIDALLRQGGIVVAASERAARAAAQTYHSMRRSEGLKAWPAPRITHWQAFVRDQWEARRSDRRMVLSPTQELAVWRTAMQPSPSIANMLRASSRRMARLAMQAHALLRSYAPEFLPANKRREWTQDAAEFSQWLNAFEQLCREGDLASEHSLAGELTTALRNTREERPPLLLVGFDRILPAQQAVFDAWGETRLHECVTEAWQKQFFVAPDLRSELAACARWARKQVEQDDSRKVLVISQDIGKLRGQIERAFLDELRATSATFEFSLGVPLSSVPLARSALLALQWASSSLSEAEVDWLITSGYTADSPATTAALQSVMRRIRRAGLERPRWTLEAFAREASRVEAAARWRSNVISACRAVDIAEERGPVEWAERARRLLGAMGWPGGRTLESGEFQALDNFEQRLEECASLGFDARKMSWLEFMTELTHVTGETLFSTQGHGSSILIAGPAESAGLEADAIWFLGANEDAWPGRGESHPFLPVWLQRQSAMPHATAQQDWQLARRITLRLTHATPEICFSYAKQLGGVDTRASRLVIELAQVPEPLPGQFAFTREIGNLARRINDRCEVPLDSPPPAFHVDSSTLSAQSQCPFKAFATARLAARNWDQAAVGLSPATRGKLLHEILAKVWSGPPNGVHESDDLRRITNLADFVEPHVADAMQTLAPEIRANVPVNYLLLEEQRLKRLVCQWLEYERERAKFSVEFTEHSVQANVSGLQLKLRLDRIDTLVDGSVLVIDYKTGDVSPKMWDLPRPEDVQLPLYAAFGLSRDEAVGGVAFAKLRAGDIGLAGRVEQPEATIGNVENLGKLRNKKLTPELFRAWRSEIEYLAAAFVRGQAEVNPREARKTCDRCGLQTICRIDETGGMQEEDSGEDQA